MSASPRQGGGLVAFRLGDVPEGIRLRAKERLLRGGPDLPPCSSFADRLAVGAAAERPSERIYFVSRAAYEKVMKTKARRR